MKDPLALGLAVILVCFVVSGIAATIYNIVNFKRLSDEEAQRRGISRYL
jgi:hypothetical protein